MSHMKNRDSNKPRRLDRQNQAKVRYDLAAARASEEQVRRLDARLGVGVGAKAERARLALKVRPAAEPAPEKAPQAKPAAPGKAPKGKKARKAAQAAQAATKA